MSTTEKELLECLMKSSRFTLRSAALRYMSESRNKEKQLNELMKEWIDATWKAELFNWFCENGEDLAMQLKKGPDIFALPHPVNRGQRALPRWRRVMAKR